MQNPSGASQKWTFNYNAQNLPARRSFAQDHWGFFNGAMSNTTLLPEEYFAIPPATISLGVSPIPYGFMPSHHDIGGNREANSSYLQAEILTSINYPTGGYTNFAYEANSVPITEEKWTKTNVQLVLNESGSMNPQTNFQSTTFTITKPQYVRISINSSVISPALDQPGAKTSAQILNQSGVAIFGISSPTKSVASSWSGSSYFNMLTAGTYTFKISTNVNPGDLVGTSNSLYIDATLNYSLSNGSQSYNKLVGGLRINNIADYDGVKTNAINDRYYVYESPLVLNPVDIKNDYLTDQQKQTHNSGTSEDCYFITTTRNSSSKFALGSIQGGTVAYGKVTTYYGLNGANGKTVSLFTNELDDHLTESKLFPYPAPDSRDHRRGLLSEETQYKSDLTTILKKITHLYSFTPKGYVIGFKAGYSVNMDSYFCTNANQDCGITRMYSNTTSELVKHDQATETTYDQNGANPITLTTSYFYDNSLNTQPVRVEVTDSKNNIIKTFNRTALEKADINAAMPLTPTASAAIDALLSRNIVGQVIQQEKQRSGVLMSRSLVNYRAWDAVILTPENIEVQNSTSPREFRVQFTGYDGKGNLLTQQKTNDVNHAYIYDYNANYLVADVTNAAQADIAFSSFEGGGTGNWTFTGTPVANATAPTGKKVYDLLTGNISKFITSSTTYTISYWRPSSLGALTITGTQAGYPITGRSVNGWTYYEHKITAVTAATITGAGLIDELRLYPFTAQMMTYTYWPLIGIQTQCDINNRINYYEYDGFQRLKTIKDQDGNILKVNDYKYKQ